MKPYLKEPRSTCDLCGTPLVHAVRYRVRIYRRVRLGGLTLHVKTKELVVCGECFRKLLKLNESRGWLIRWRKLRELKVGELY